MFKSFAIHGVERVTINGQIHIEECDDSEADYFGLYGYDAQGDCHWIADYTTRELAEKAQARKEKETVYSLGIDVLTKDKKKLITRLAKLKTTISVTDGGEYSMDRHYSQIHIDTHMTEEQLDNWLYKVKHNADYQGTFHRR